MASGNTQRRVSFVIDTDVVGSEAVNRLASDIRGLAKNGGDAAPVFEKLANEVESLGQQSAAIAATQRLQSEVDKLAAAAQEASTQSAALAEKMAALTAASNAADAGLADARNNEQQLIELRKRQVLALSEYRNSTEAAAASDNVFAAKVRELRSAVLDTTGKIIEAQAARRRAKEAADEAGAAESALAEKVRRAEAETTKANQALKARSEALRESQVAAGQLGVDTQNLVAEQTRLASALKANAAAANEQQAALEESARQAAEAKEIQAAFAEAVKRADAAMAEQVATLRQTESAIETYNAAQTEAISLGQQDVAANERRLAAAQALLRTDELLSASQRELANARNATRAATIQEAQALVQVAQAARESLAATQALVNETRSAGRVIEQAFAATGVRSLQAIETEIAQTEAALSTLERKFRAGAISADDLARATAGAELRLSQLKAEATTMPAAPGVFERISTQITGLANRFGALSAAVATFALALKPVVDAEIELQKLNRVLNTVTGSSQETAKTIEFLRSVSQAAGQSFSEVSSSYAKFAAAAVNSGVPLQQVNEIFRATANAAGNMGLSVDETSRILTALGQIASKGVVSMEELRQQLGDALPGALALTAKELGVTQADLTKMIEQGRLLAADGLPAIGRAMTALASKSGEVGGIVAEFNRFKNVVLEAGTVLADGPFGAAAGAIGFTLSKTLQGIAVIVAGVSESFRVAGATIYGIIDAIVNRDLSRLGSAINDAALKGGDNLRGLRDRFLETGDGAEQSAAKVKTVEDATRAAGVAAAAQAQAFQSSVGAINANAAASEALAAAQEAARRAIEAVKSATSDQSATWVAAQVEYAKASDAAQVSAQAADRLAQAKAAEGEAVRAATSLTQNEVLVQQVRARTALETAAALQQQAAADQAVVNVAIAERDALLQLVQAQGGATEAQAKYLEQLAQVITTKQADADKTKAQADAAGQNAAALQQQALTLADNSAHLATYQAALEAARNEQLRLRTEVDAGIASKQQLVEADRAVAEAEGLVADALKDTAENAKLNTQAIKNEYDLKVQLLTIQKSQLESEAALLEAQGRGNEAVQKKIEAKRLEIEIIRATIEAKQAEIAATRAEVEATRAALEATGELTRAKQLELDARLAALRVKDAEIAAARQRVDVIQQQINNLQTYGSESQRVFSQSASAIGQETAAVQSNTSAWMENGKARTDAQGYALNTNGDRVSALVTDPSWAFQFLKANGASDAVAAAIVAEFTGSDGKLFMNNSYQGSSLPEKLLNALKQRGSGGGINTGGSSGGGYIGGGGSSGGGGSLGGGSSGGGGGINAGGTRTGGGSGNSGGSGSSGPGVSNTIIIGGKEFKVDVMDDASAANLTDLLTELANAQGRSFYG